MNPKKLLALALALVLALISTGAIAYAQSADAAPAEIAESTPDGGMEAPDPENEADAGETEISNVIIPGAIAETPEPEQGGEESVAPDVEPEIEPTEEPTPTLPPESESAPTEAPTAEPTSAPAIPEIYVSPYASVSSGTILYKDASRNEKLGKLLDDAIMLVNEVAAYERGSVYEARFVTDESLQADACEHAYFFASSLELLDKEQTEACLNSVGVRKVDGKPVFMADVLYEAPAAEETDAPEEVAEPTNEPIPPENDAEPTDEPIPPENDAEPTDEPIPPEDNAEPTDEPEIVLPEETEPPVLYAMKYFDANGHLLATYEVEGGKAFEEEVFLFEEGTFLGWYPCDENGVYTGITPYDFSQPAEGPIYLRARVRTAAEVAPKSVIVTTSYDTETLQLGSQITLTATLTGYEGLNYTCYWQYAAANSDGSIIGEWQNAQSGDLSFTYVLTETNLLTAWRMCVTVNE